MTVRSLPILFALTLDLCCAEQARSQPRPPPPAGSPAQPEPVDQFLAWDATTKEHTVTPGETNTHFAFNVTNISSEEVVIKELLTSCGCTVAKMPSQPWRLSPGSNGQIEADLDIRGKSGFLTKLVSVDSSRGFKVLTVKVNIPRPPGLAVEMRDRGQNVLIAAANRQAIFKNDCASCHLTPLLAKTGEALYQAACAICHDSAHRASMVPDLHALNHPTDRPFWKNAISLGKAGTLMPAFANSSGGPLTEDQISSLTDLLVQKFPSTAGGAAVGSR